MQKGFSLVEVMVAFVVIAFGAMIAFQSFVFSAQNERNSYDKQIMAQEMQNTIEVLSAHTQMLRDSNWNDERRGLKIHWTLSVLDSFDLQQKTARGLIPTDILPLLYLRPQECMLSVQMEKTGMTFTQGFVRP
jgi:prepilin-type N-terminal cleavage/methylation domain-containing protein